MKFIVILAAALVAAPALPQTDAPNAPIIDACAQKPPHPRVKDCKRFAPLLGRWTSRKHGGIVETTLSPDGTIEGKIAQLNPLMTARGFRPGEHILRGWKPAMSGGTWIMVGRDGQYFTAKQPDRNQGDPFGARIWTKAGILYLEKARPDQLNMPAILEERLSNREPWIRMPPVAAPVQK